MPSNHLILCRPLLLLPPIPPSIRVFPNESTLRKRWPKYWSFSFSISPSNEHPGLISFRIDCLDLVAVQGTLKSLLQHHRSKASILRCSALFIVQLSLEMLRPGYSWVTHIGGRNRGRLHVGKAVLKNPSVTMGSRSPGENTHRIIEAFISLIICDVWQCVDFMLR